MIEKVFPVRTLYLGGAISEPAEHKSLKTSLESVD